MNGPWFFGTILNRLVDVIPWLLGGIAGMALFTFSPLGRELVQRLRLRRHEVALSEAMLQELGEIRHLLGETVERLDATERKLAQLDASPVPLPALHPQPPSPREDPVRTPH